MLNNLFYLVKRTHDALDPAACMHAARELDLEGIYLHQLEG